MTCVAYYLSKAVQTIKYTTQINSIAKKEATQHSYVDFKFEPCWGHPAVMFGTLTRATSSCCSKAAPHTWSQCSSLSVLGGWAEELFVRLRKQSSWRWTGGSGSSAGAFWRSPPSLSSPPHQKPPLSAVRGIHENDYLTKHATFDKSLNLYQSSPSNMGWNVENISRVKSCHLHHSC